MRGRLPSRQPSGLYVHSSPPTGVPVHDSVVRQWLRGGEMSRLKELVLEGEGAALVGEYSPDITARAFIRALPRVLNRIEEAHAAVSVGDLERAERAVRRERAVRVELSKDQAGLSLLHKAVIRGHHHVLRWLLDNFPEIVHLTDRERRSALHYAGSSREPEETWKLLTEAGADPGLTDANGFSPAYYMHHPRRARPPQPRDPRGRPDRGLVVKPANIRIWIHDRDLGRLQKVVWEGFGHKLLSETSSQPKVRRFLSAVPYILGSIRDVHKSAIENDVETLIKRTEDPVPKDILLSKDSNGLTPLHKAAGLGNQETVKEILSRAPEAANVQDALGRTPLHYTASLKDGHLYQLLVDGGAVDHLQDKKGKTPSYYRSRPGELEAGKMLTYVPEAPRTAHIFPPSWDWRLLHSTSSIRQKSSEAIPQEPTVEEPTKVEEGVEESRPEVSEDEGVGSENAQSVDDTASPQNSENLDMEPEEESNVNLNNTITLSRSEFFGEDSGVVDIDAADVLFDSPQQESLNIVHNEDLQETDQKDNETTENINGINSNDTQKETEEAMHNSDSRLSNELEGNSIEVEMPIEHEQSLTTTPDDNKDDLIVGQNSSEVEETEATPLVRSGTVVLESDNNQILNEHQDRNTEEPVEMNKEAQDKDLYEPTNLDDEKGEISTESTFLNEHGHETPPVEPTEVRENISTSDGQTKATYSGNNKKIPSSRRSLKSRALKAIELGRGQVELFEMEDKANNPSVQKENETSNSEAILQENDGIQDKIEDNTVIETAPEENDSKTERSVQGNDTSTGKSEENDETAIQNNSKEESQEITDEGEEIQQTVLQNNESKANEISEIQNANSEDHQEIKEEYDELKVIRHQSCDDGKEQDQVEDDDVNIKESNIIESKEPSEEYFPDSLEGSTGGETVKNENTGDTKVETETNTNKEVRREDKDSSTELGIVSSPGSNKRAERQTEAERLVFSADMEGMAEMVLSGEGEALLDLKSDNPDVQLFINNVPQYMAKIERVHKASREGDLRGVQTSLDRRKFAVARDNGTSLKPTPLHVAVLFGRTSVLRYLAGRFPETMHAQDSGGRTPLHYATTLPDNGHFYSLLITLGADKALPDSAGKTAEYYLRNKDELTRDMLIAEYQDRTVPIDMSGLNFNRYSDKVEEDTVSARHDVDEEALLEQMERCYRLILHRAPSSVLGQILNRELYEELRLRYTRLDNTLLDILRPVGKDLGLGKNRVLTDPNFSGITIPDTESFRVFSNLIEPLVKEISGAGVLENPAESDFTGGEPDAYFNIDIDPGGAIIKSCIVEIARNLSIVPFSKNLKLSDLEKVEVALSTVLTAYYKRNKEAAFIDEAGENHGSYYSMSEVVENKELFQDLKEEGLLVEGVSEGNWPYGRGVFISPYGDVTGWVNVREHIHLMSATPAEKRGDIGQAYKTATEIVSLLEEKVESARDRRLGLLATDPALIGNCLRLHVLASLPHIGEDLVALRKLACSKGLVVEENPSPGVFRIRNRSCQGSTEIQTFKAFVPAISEIIEAEKASMKVTVTQIPHLIKTFLRKKSSKTLLSDLNK